MMAPAAVCCDSGSGDADDVSAEVSPPAAAPLSAVLSNGRAASAARPAAGNTAPGATIIGAEPATWPAICPICAGHRPFE